MKEKEFVNDIDNHSYRESKVQYDLTKSQHNKIRKYKYFPLELMYCKHQRFHNNAFIPAGHIDIYSI